MNTPRVPPAGAPASPSAGAAGLVSVASEIVRLPQELAARLLQAPRTVFLTGTVTGQAADGALQVRSQFGEIALRAGTNVPPDRQVSLQIPPLSGKAAELPPAQLARNPIPVTLLLPRPAVAQPAGQPQAGPVAAGATPGPQPPAAPAQAIPSAQVGPAGQSPAPAPAPSTPGPTPAGSPPTAPALPGAVTVAGGAVPPTVASPNQAVPAGSPATAPSPAPTGSPATPASAVQTTAPTGQPAGTAPQLGRPALSPQVVTQAANPPATPAPQGQPPQSRVPTTPTPQGTPAQTPAPNAANPAPPSPAPSGLAMEAGGRIGEAARPAPPTLPVAAGFGGDHALPIESARRVPALREAMSVLSAADPALATQFVRSVIPQGNAQLAATLLFFLSATRGGDIRGWVGDRVAARLEDAGRADLLPRLSAELAGAPRPAPDPAAGEWRSQTVPLYQDADVGGIRMHVRTAGDEDGAADDSDGGGQRFLIDMDLSRMGPLQLDGLVRDKRLDVTIRSKAAFPDSMRQDMRTLFRDASETVGLHGGLTFQAGGHDWVTVATARSGA